MVLMPQTTSLPTCSRRWRPSPYLRVRGTAADTHLVSSDAHQFTNLLRVARSERALALGALEQAHALYEADLLDSPTTPPFAWAIDPGDDGTSLRQRHRKQFLDASRRLADLHLSGGEGAYVERAVDLYRRLVQVDPSDERTWRALLSAHANGATGRLWTASGND
jgi:DNA-binding SARP family transcriptional activator